MKQPDLLARIEAHNLDAADATFPFSQRLARDNGWSLKFAQQVIEDYKKFVYLCCVSETRLTPSDAVDQAWHLHLTYSYDYWEVFCHDVLGRKLHHGPTKGGEAQDRTFRTAYQATLDLYGTEFGHSPPIAIWPPLSERFNGLSGFKRLDTARLILMPKRTVCMVGVAACAAVLTACAWAKVENLTQNKAHLHDFWGVLLALGAFIFIFIIAWLFRSRRRPPGGENGKYGCSARGDGCAGL